MNKVQRMQVGYDWSSSFLFKGGDPPVPISIVDWTVAGTATLTAWTSKYVDLLTYQTYPPQPVNPIEPPGTPPIAIDPKLTFMDYVIQESDLAYDQTLVPGQTVNLLVVTLIGDDTYYLGPGMVDFEIIRSDPTPNRPILRFRIMNHEC